MLGLITAGAGLAKGIAGGILGGKARRAKKRLIDEKERKEEEWYNRNYFSNYLDSAEAQAAMKRVENTLRRQNEQAAATAAVMGSTPEAALAEKESNNQLLGDVTTGLASVATARKNAVDAQHQSNQNAIFAERMGQEDANERGFSTMKESGLGILGTALQGSDLVNKWVTQKEKTTGTGGK